MSRRDHGPAGAREGLPRPMGAWLSPVAGRRSVTDRVGLWVPVLLVVVLFGLPLFRGLGHAELTGDEPIYAFAVDRMLENGDWPTPRSMPHDDAAFFEKPPLKFWIVAASMRAGFLPQDEFGHRFWDAAFGLVAFLYVFAIGRMAGGWLCGLVAVLVLFLHRPLLLEHGLRSNNMEAALVLAYCGGIYHALAWVRAETPWRRWSHPIACALWFVLGFMTKFAAAIFLPGVLVATALVVPLWRRRLRADAAPWAVAALLSVVAIAPWFVYQGLRDESFWRIILAEHVLQRFSTFIDPLHVQPWHFYLVTGYQALGESPIWGSTVSLVAVGLILLLVRTVRTRWDVGAVILLWLLLPLVAISLSSSKLYHYAYPFLPPLGLAVGYLLAVLTGERGPLRVGFRHAIAWAERSWLLRRIAAAPAAVRWSLSGLGLAAIALGTFRILHGSIRIAVGDLVLLRIGDPIRPIAVGMVLLTLAGQGAAVSGPLLAPLVLLSMPAKRYRAMVGRLDEGGAPLRTMARCLLEVQAGGTARGLLAVHVPDRPWGFAYYFRPAGWRDVANLEDPELAPSLFDPGTPRPVLLRQSHYTTYRERLAGLSGGADELVNTALVRLGQHELLLLPGPYARCAEVVPRVALPVAHR